MKQNIILLAISIIIVFGFIHSFEDVSREFKMKIDGPKEIFEYQSFPLQTWIKNLSEHDTLNGFEPSIVGGSLQIILEHEDKIVEKQSLRNIAGAPHKIKYLPLSEFNIIYDLSKEFPLGLKSGNYSLQLIYLPDYGKQVLSNKIEFKISSLPNYEKEASKYYLFIKDAESNDIEKSENIFEKRFPNSIFLDKVKLLKGEDLFFRKQYTESIKILNDVVKSRKSTITEKEDALILISYCYHKQNDNENALKTLEKVKKRTMGVKLTNMWYNKK